MMEKETRCIDEGICPHCGKRFDAARAINYDISLEQLVDCPHCGKGIFVFASVEYHCSIPED
jgi:ParB family chromosome partitioning protein